AADRLDFLGDLARGAPRGALERHVFEEMRDAMLVGAFIAAARSDPDAERGALQMRHCVGDDHQAGWQARDVHAHAAAPSRAARLAARMKRSTAPCSAGSTATRSARVPRSPSQSGNGGRVPLAASTASGNFAAWAVERTTIGVAGSRGSFSATATATAVCG